MTCLHCIAPLLQQYLINWPKSFEYNWVQPLELIQLITNVTVASLLILDSNGPVTIPNLQGGVTYTVSGQAPPAQGAAPADIGTLQQEIRDLRQIIEDNIPILEEPNVVRRARQAIRRWMPQRVIYYWDIAFRPITWVILKVLFALVFLLSIAANI
ncbi:hypothetical protein PROFUN_17113 [Planoprotostelium fungivorum]|uniref:Uncharacterized protein n=1 Tax=Planoprotostelium fungivorum TaxID=1890364 RepID=A0A2P6MMG0_9EUKA|nr:hypothetical protein PROFUN_17113 [Planoprotostelium fungivorum]